MAETVGVMMVGLALMSAAAGLLMAIILNQGGPLPYSTISYVAGISLAVVIFTPLAIRTIRKNKTLAKVEIIGSNIREFNEKGEFYVEGDLRNVVSLVEKHAYRGPVRYYVFFKDGQVLSFNSQIDQEFRLRKILQNWSGLKFEVIDSLTPFARTTLEPIDRRYPPPLN
jgi:hypothetical protein